MKTYTVTASYSTGSTGDVEFPEGRSWEDVEDWYVKWDTLHVVFKDGVGFEAKLNSRTDGETDWKYPSDVSVYAVDENGDTDYDVEIAEA